MSNNKNHHDILKSVNSKLPRGGFKDNEHKKELKAANGMLPKAAFQLEKAIKNVIVDSTKTGVNNDSSDVHKADLVQAEENVYNVLKNIAEKEQTCINDEVIKALGTRTQESADIGKGVVLNSLLNILSKFLLDTPAPKPQSKPQAKPLGKLQV